MERYWWLNEESQQILNRDYLLRGETVQDAVNRVCTAAAKRTLGDSETLDGKDLNFYIEVYKELVERGWMSLSSPVWSNMGTRRGLPISCFNVHIGDSIANIGQKVSEVMMQTKLGGGTSAYFGELRARGAAITNNGTSSGSASFAKIFDAVMAVVSQGTTRRGGFAGYQDIDHPDIEEFLDFKEQHCSVKNLLMGVVVPDYWLMEMMQGDVEKRKLWAKVIEKRRKKGFPYIFFKDNVNHNRPEIYKKLNIIINASNLCLTGDQRVVTSLGYLTAKELNELDIELDLFNGQKLVKASKMKLRGKKEKVYKITYANGMTQKVTANHGIPVVNGRKGIKRVECKDLKIGDSVALQTQKGLFGIKDMKDEAFLLGLYQSDGTQYKDTIMLDLWENDFDILEEVQNKFDKLHYKYKCDTYNIINQLGAEFSRTIEPAVFHECQVSNGNVRKKRLSSRTLKKALNFEKGYVPEWIWKSNEQTQWEYIRGLLIADGTINVCDSHGKPCQLAYSDINKEFLQELQILFTNLGINSKIYLLRKKGEELLPDGKGGSKYYDAKDCWRLVVSNKNDLLTIEKNTGFLSRKGKRIKEKVYRDNTKKKTKVVSIEYIGKEDVYCPTVYNEEHIFISQGLKTFNCSEICLPSTHEESFVCCLASMNLELYNEWKDTDAVKYAIYFLDAIMSEFIEKSKDIEFLGPAHRFAKRHRAVGLGVMGWHSYLQKNMIPFEDYEAMVLNNAIFKDISTKANQATLELAELLGPAPIYSEYDGELKDGRRRNTTVMAIAPTTSSSAILGQVSPGIEPFLSNDFKAALAKGNFIRKNKWLKKLLEEKGLDNYETWNQIHIDKGSVKNIDGLTQREKDVFKTFQEISQMTIINQASQRQQYIDQSQSLNIIIPPSVSPKDINELMLHAWKSGVKTLYYQRGKSLSKDILSNIVSCKSCES